jgi:hypothetical protein
VAEIGKQSTQLVDVLLFCGVLAGPLAVVVGGEAQLELVFGPFEDARELVVAAQ